MIYQKVSLCRLCIGNALTKLQKSDLEILQLLTTGPPRPAQLVSDLGLETGRKKRVPRSLRNGPAAHCLIQLTLAVGDRHAVVTSLRASCSLITPSRMV